MTFTCMTCGRGHPALPPEDPPEKDPAKRAELKAAWDKAYSRWSPKRSAPLAENRYLQGRLALTWLYFARVHGKEGRLEHAMACLETAKAHWERRKFLGSKEERERRHAAVDRAGQAYLTASRYTGVCRVPDTILSGRDGLGGGTYLHCAKPCKPVRADGLRRGQDFVCVQLFDQEGYVTTVTAPTKKEALEKAAKRTHKNKTLTACSMPFKGSWEGTTMNVSAPSEFKEAMALLDHPANEA